MTRLKISIAVLSTLILFSFFNTLTVKYKCNYMLESIEEIKKTASSDKEKAVELSKDLKKYLDKNSDYLNLLVSSDYLGEIGIGFSKSDEFISDDSSESDAELNSLAELIRQLDYSITPTIYTVF